MVVVALPEEGPKITGGLPRYQIGDWVHVNCSSGRSKPATTLSWYINGDLVTERVMLIPYSPFVTGREGLETSTLGLKFQVRHKHFKKGDMKLKVSELFPCDCHETQLSVSFASSLLTVLGHNRIRLLAQQRGECGNGTTSADTGQGILGHDTQQLQGG